MIYLIDPSEITKSGCKKLTCDTYVPPVCKDVVYPLYGIDPTPI